MKAQLGKFGAVIFDCDGVLVESERLGLRSLQQALRDAGVERSLEYLARFSGRSHGETLAELEAGSGVSLTASGAAQRMDDHYIRLATTEGLEPCPGISEMLSWLTTRRIPFTLASSGPRRKVRFSLQCSGLLQLFPRFVCGDDVARAKPEPDVYLSAAQLLAVEPGTCLAIEDAPNGVRAARAAGMKVVAVTTSFTATELQDSDLVVDSLTDLPRYLPG